MDSKVSTALLITELLENILVRLDMKTLLLGQRVCHKWYGVINTSSELQKKLFMLPVVDVEEVIRLDMVEDRVCTSRTKGLRRVYWNHANYTPDPAAGHGIVNPMIDYILPTGGMWVAGKLSMEEGTRKRLKKRLLGMARRKGPKAVIEPSWRRMLLAQPTREMHLVYDESSGLSNRRATLEAIFGMPYDTWNHVRGAGRRVMDLVALLTSLSQAELVHNTPMSIRSKIRLQDGLTHVQDGRREVPHDSIIRSGYSG